ncbi:hypothetical protein [Mycobacteroides abscessus]|nr:hypothetical protein [Mycobacteroides abscessus]MDO3331407.1 hypothetical protein [Mycobacteroides abscessus subsp. abscessus]
MTGRPPIPNRNWGGMSNQDKINAVIRSRAALGQQGQVGPGR